MLGEKPNAGNVFVPRGGSGSCVGAGRCVTTEGATDCGTTQGTGTAIRILFRTCAATGVLASQSDNASAPAEPLQVRSAAAKHIVRGRICMLFSVIPMR